MGRRATWLAMALCVPLFALALWKPRAPRVLDTFGELPDFHLTDSAGQPIRRDTLRGKVWVASFFFTSCPMQCPMLISKLKGVEGKLAGERGFRLVSFTVDAATDTPEVLARYAEKHGAPREHWDFVTGPQAQLDALSADGFHLGNGGAPTAHTFKVVLVDREARLRGYYDGLDDKQLTQLAADARNLLNLAHQAR